MYHKNLLILLIPVLFASLIFFGCKKKDDAAKTVISVKGSDTMVNLSQRWAEVYMEKNPNVSIQVTGGGSGTGIAAIINGTTDIANSSRDMKDNELETARGKNVNPKQYEVALDGIALIVHPENGIDSLTVQQVSDIFIGKINNWNQIGGNNMPITLYGRENSSGTYEFFKEHVLGKNAAGRANDYANSTQVLQGTAALGEAVARDKKGIGYGGVGYFAHRTDVKILHIKADQNSPAISPSENSKVNYDAIWDGTYSISRYLYCYIDEKKTEGEIQKFMDFILSSDGQKLVETMEYIPLPTK
ncbi:MAG: phosphate ABC transporter substrate-binding protein [Ignavibacteriaceae bacterium]